MVMGIAKCVWLAGVATCARRPMCVFARSTACAMQARCAKWRSGQGPILLRSCARTLKSTRAVFFSHHSYHSSHRTGSPGAPGPPRDTCSRGGRPSRASYIIFYILLASLVPSHPIFYILLVSLVRKGKYVIQTFSFLQVIRVICKK